MRSVFALVLIVGLLGCSKPATDPVGTYVFSKSDKAFVLEVQPKGEYVLLTKRQDGSSNEIRGHWEKETPPGPSISLHGIIWRGTEPEAGHGIWAASIDSDSKICLDAEELDCFTKPRFGDAKFRATMAKSRQNAENEFDKFYFEIIDSIEKRRFDAISSAVAYPISVEVDGKNLEISDAETFRKNSEKIFGEAFTLRILSDKEKLSYLSNGVVVGRGELWLNVIEQGGTYRWKIIAINN